MSRDKVFKVLAHLHARGLHAAVLAAMVVMPTVATVGYLTQNADRDESEPLAAIAGLRPTLPTDGGPAPDR